MPPEASVRLEIKVLTDQWRGKATFGQRRVVCEFRNEEVAEAAVERITRRVPGVHIVRKHRFLYIAF